MSKKTLQDPLEQLPKQIRDLLKSSPFDGGFQSGVTTESKGSSSSPPDSENEAHQEALNRLRHFNLRPREIRDHLDRFVIQQREAKKVLSVAICDHYNHVRHCLEEPSARERDYAKQNILLLGPTGVGKTSSCAASLA